MSKHRSLQVPQEHAGDKISATERKRRKALTIEEKLEIIKRYEENGRTCDTDGCEGVSFAFGSRLRWENEGELRCWASASAQGC